MTGTAPRPGNMFRSAFVGLGRRAQPLHWSKAAPAERCHSKRLGHQRGRAYGPVVGSTRHAIGPVISILMIPMCAVVVVAFSIELSKLVVRNGGGKAPSLRRLRDGTLRERKVDAGHPCKETRLWRSPTRAPRPRLGGVRPGRILDRSHADSVSDALVLIVSPPQPNRSPWRWKLPTDRWPTVPVVGNGGSRPAQPQQEACRPQTPQSRQRTLAREEPDPSNEFGSAPTANPAGRDTPRKYNHPGGSAAKDAKHRLLQSAVAVCSSRGGCSQET